MIQEVRLGHRPELPDKTEISFGELFSIVVSKKWYLLLSFFLVLSASTVYTSVSTPQYEASSLLLITSESSSPQLGQLLGLETANRKVANEIEIIKSRAIALRVADALLDWQTIPGTQIRLSILKSNPDQPVLTQADVADRL